ncbi:pyocin activator PrtN family protein [Cupriavidus basilensis]|uniref:pyocin activator PrtN family protein n=1 Tax=Cupriavidus basilensis TaxID=68895 RepID=UPI0039F678AD
MAQGPAIGFISGITLPQGRIRIEGSNKSAKGIHVGDLAKYIDERRAATLKKQN